MGTALQAAATHQPYFGHVEAYCVFKDREILQILTKPEYEAIADGDAALKGFSGKTQVAYVVANQHQLVQSLVLFYLPLDEQGYCLDGWQLPLHRLADTAGRGPNLGGGRIRLACQSQCSISWHEDSLWDPSTSTFVAVKKSIASAFDRLVEDMTGIAECSTEQSPIDDDVENLKRILRNEAATYRNQLQSLQQEIERQQLLNERLLRKEQRQTVSVENRIDLQVLRQQNQVLQQRVRELEVVNENLHAQMSVHPNTGTEDVNQDLIERMAQAEMLSVVFHAGVGHINLSSAQVEEYLEDPEAYAAHQVSLSKEQYLEWKGHHDRPRCQTCDGQIPIIADPSIFDPEIDVYCDQHKPV